MIEDLSAAKPLQWNPELNMRRFELIDGDIQRTLSSGEQIELAGLTQLIASIWIPKRICRSKELENCTTY